MSDDRKEESSAPSSEPEGNRDGGGDTASPLPPFVPYDDSATMAAIFAHRRRATAAALAGSNQVFGFQEAGGSGFNQAPFGDYIGAGTGTLIADVSVLPDWTAMRAEMIARLDAIEASLRRIAPFIETFETTYREHARIGHNNPPEDIDILPIGLGDLQLGIVAASLARTEVNTEHARFDVLRLCGLVLNEMATRVLACLQWIGAKGDVFLDAFLKSAGTEAGKRVAQTVGVLGTAAGMMMVMKSLHGDLTSVDAALRHVFELLNLPF